MINDPRPDRRLSVPDQLAFRDRGIEMASADSDLFAQLADSLPGICKKRAASS